MATNNISLVAVLVSFIPPSFPASRTEGEIYILAR